MQLLFSKTNLPSVNPCPLLFDMAAPTMGAMSETVLIFDDEESSTRSLTRFLEKSYGVLAARTIDEFQRHLSREPSIVFCDLVLPNGSGLDNLKLAKEQSPCSARILISGFLDQDNLIVAINRDLAHRVLAKPWSIEQLAVVTAEAQAVHRLLKERKYWEEVSLTDGLTHLWNRRGFLQNLVRELHRARRHQRFLSLIMIDVDNFKRTNDSQGHPEGDALLLAVAKTLHSSVRTIDWVARYGGDEFAIILPEVDHVKAWDIAERLRSEVETKTHETISVGISFFPTHGQDPVDLINAADQALYSAKTQGRNQTIIAGTPKAE
ncbi:MAG: hypothetical protein C5B49_14805 [Bdellovibrio sp.]|nr:MAG: hypothetical protein C5B49_14805 [Bdellovibrio sp.]